MRIKFVELLEQPSHDWTIRKIRYWYDMHERMWCIELLDGQDTPVEIIHQNKFNLNDMLKDLCKFHNVSDCKKY